MTSTILQTYHALNYQIWQNPKEHLCEYLVLCKCHHLGTIAGRCVKAHGWSMSWVPIWSSQRTIQLQRLTAVVTDRAPHVTQRTGRAARAVYRGTQSSIGECWTSTPRRGNRDTAGTGGRLIHIEVSFVETAPRTKYAYSFVLLKRCVVFLYPLCTSCRVSFALALNVASQSANFYCVLHSGSCV